MSEELKEAIAALEAAQEKLKLYRMEHSGEYIGGVEYTDLQERISGSIFNLTVYAAKQEADDGRMLPVLPNDWELDGVWERDGFYSCRIQEKTCSDEEAKTIYQRGTTPRAAVLAAIAKIPKQNEKER